MRRSNIGRDERMNNRLTIGQIVCITLVGVFFLVSVVRTAHSEISEPSAGAPSSSDNEIKTTIVEGKEVVFTPDTKLVPESQGLQLKALSINPGNVTLLKPTIILPSKRTLEFNEGDRKNVVLRHPLMTPADHSNIKLIPLRTPQTLTATDNDKAAPVAATHPAAQTTPSSKS